MKIWNTCHFQTGNKKIKLSTYANYYGTAVTCIFNRITISPIQNRRKYVIIFFCHVNCAPLRDIQIPLFNPLAERSLNSKTVLRTKNIKKKKKNKKNVICIVGLVLQVKQFNLLVYHPRHFSNLILKRTLNSTTVLRIVVENSWYIRAASAPFIIKDLRILKCVCFT